MLTSSNPDLLPATKNYTGVVCRNYSMMWQTRMPGCWNSRGQTGYGSENVVYVIVCGFY